MEMYDKIHLHCEWWRKPPLHVAVSMWIGAAPLEAMIFTFLQDWNNKTLWFLIWNIEISNIYTIVYLDVFLFVCLFFYSSYEYLRQFQKYLVKYKI